MNPNSLHNMLKLKDTTIYCVFQELIKAHQFYNKYKLFNFYLFRTDCLKDLIQKKEYFFYDENSDYIIDGKINYRNKYVKKYVNDNAQLYIGNTYIKEHGFCPVFLSYSKGPYIISRNTNKFESCSRISGYSVNIRSEVDAFYFDDSTTKKLNRRLSEDDMMMDLVYGSEDLKKHLDEMNYKTGLQLNKLGM